MAARPIGTHSASMEESETYPESDGTIVEIDTDVHVADEDPIRLEIPALKEFANNMDFAGNKIWFSDTEASKIADTLEDGEPDRERFEWDERGESDYEKAKELYNNVGRVFGFDENYMKEMADNIRAGIQKANSPGYEY